MRIGFFDFNGTVLDDMPIWYEAVCATFRAFGKEPPSAAQYFRELKSDYLDIYRSRGITAPREEVDAVYAKAYEARIAKTALFEGVFDALEALRGRGVTMVLLTMQLSKLAAPLFDAFGIREFFSRCECGVVDKASAIARMLEAEGISPKDAFLVGDAPSDIRHAKKAGITAVAYLNGFIPEDIVLAARPDYVIRNLSELADVVARADGTEGRALSRGRFRALLPSLCDRETTHDALGWTPQNPLWGHCAVVSCAAQTLFGGKVAWGKIPVPDRDEPLGHYWNIMPDGTKEDLTAAQFVDGPVALPTGRNITGSAWHSRIRRSKRYKILLWRLAKSLNAGNSLFEDELYQRCFFKALESGCQKMLFGSVIVRERKKDGKLVREVVAEGNNSPIAPLRSWCKPTCARLCITSRTASDIGACDHAEETAIWNAVRKGIDLSQCELYIAGLHANGMPWFKERAEHTCIRCAREMWRARLRGIWAPVKDHWERYTPEKALETARAYATGERSV